MANYEFKSKVVKIFDFKKIYIKNSVKNFKPDREQLDHDIMLLRKKNAVTDEVTQIVSGDYARLECKCKKNARFNAGDITVRVGKGLYNKTLENQLVGMSVGEEKELEAGEYKVLVRVLSVSRRTLPELNDENVPLWNTGGAKTVKELKQYLINEQQEDNIRDIAGKLTRYIAEEANQRSRFEIDMSEFEEGIRTGLAMAYEVMQSQGVDLNKTSDSEALKIIGMTKTEYIRYVEKQLQNDLKSALVGAELMKRNNYTVPESDYEKAVLEKMELEGKSREDIERVYTPAAFMQQQAANYYFLLIKDHVIKYLKGERN